MSTRIANEKIFQITFRKRAVIGTVGGLVGGFAIFLIIFAIDSSLGIIPGTFYKIVGIPIGLEGTAATVFGLVAHMLTAGLIGAVFCYCSGIHKKLDIKTSTKGALAGGVTGIAVYAILFLPITLFVMNPALETLMINEEGIVATVLNVDSVKLVENMDLIIIGSLEIHIVYGIIMGVFCAMALKHERENYSNISDLKKTLKIITIGIILATAAIGSYYALSPTQISTTNIQSKLNVEMNKVVDELTYTKFVAMNEKERTALVRIMPIPTINLILEEAKKYDTTVSENMDEITSHLVSYNDLRFVQVTDFQGLKGMQASGKAMVISTGNKTFLRFEEFHMTNGLDLYVYLTKSGDIDAGIEVDKLKANHGDQNYEITGIDTNQYNIVMIYSKSFNMIYATAQLPK